MSRELGRSVLAASAVALLLTPVRASAPESPHPAILQRFLALDDPTPSQVRALRHLEARNERFDKSAWMDVWTQGDASGFRYQVVGEGGSDYIRSHVFRASLDTERKVWASGAPEQAGMTPANYVFEDRGGQPDGLGAIAVSHRRHDLLLVEGSIFLNPVDGELMRMEGRLSKSPSFWMRHVEIVRWYRRIAGFRMPIALETAASLRIAGQSTFRMTYDYESVNGQRVGNPGVRASLQYH